LRARLGAAAHAWWQQHATVSAATAGFEQLLDEARAMPDRAINADQGMSLTRRILDDLQIGPHTLGLDSWL